MVYQYKNSRGVTYFLHTVKSRAEKNLYYFRKAVDTVNPSRAIDLPQGFSIVEGKKSGLPCLKKSV